VLEDLTDVLVQRRVINMTDLPTAALDKLAARRDHRRQTALSALAREELEHFEQVLRLLQARAIPLRPLPAPAYGATLTAVVRRGEPERMLDAFLVAGLIEARSHERMALLAAHSPEPELQDLYGALLASEARHFGLYWLLAEERYGREATVARLEQLAAVEVQALTGELVNPEDVRMHSVGVIPEG
jgi:tRNA-(ms[2]io[6]A)-hydroxylase